MADYIIKIIPRNPYAFVSVEDIENIVEWLRKEIPADQIEVQRAEIPRFVDCGGSLERITCPVCGVWGKQPFCIK